MMRPLHGYGRCVFCVVSAGSWVCVVALFKVLQDGEMSSDSFTGPPLSSVLSSVFWLDKLLLQLFVKESHGEAAPQAA